MTRFIRPDPKPFVDAAAKDADRTLAGKNMGEGHYVVTAMEVRFLRYDEARDGLFFHGGTVTFAFDQEDMEG